VDESLLADKSSLLLFQTVFDTRQVCFKDVERASCLDVEIPAGCDFRRICQLSADDPGFKAQRYELGFIPIRVYADCIRCGIYADQPDDFNLQPCFFEHLAHASFCCAFARIDMAARKTPAPIIRPASEEDGALLILDKGGGSAADFSLSPDSGTEF